MTPGAVRKLRGTGGRNTRILGALWSGVMALLRSVLASVRVLFLQVSGFIFICFSIIFVSAFVHEFRKYVEHQVGMPRVVVAGAIGAMFFYFGMSSFWRARRKRS
ncbi:MAG: hypothetical protein CXZ00_13885 [Acidobacteria bacterium]|nr:MAG: hypothetical protein CXZ00_13885 [Acidobacteriota bacterium]